MASTPVTFRVSGLSQVVSSLIALGVDVDDLKDAFSDIANEGAVVVSAAAPKLTGRLAADVRGNRAKSKAVVTVGRVSVPYAGAINYGWSAHNISPAGFLQEGDRVWQPYALQRLERALNDQIAKKGLR